MKDLNLNFKLRSALKKYSLLKTRNFFFCLCSPQIRDVHRDFYQKSSELFESEVYLEEVSDVLCIAQAG